MRQFHRPQRDNRAVLSRRATAVLTVLAAVATLGAMVATGGPAHAQGLIPAPITAVSPDGLSATDGVRTLSADQTQGLPSSGGQVTVAGSGYDSNKGIYVAFCLIPPTNQLPTPCGGGVDTTGSTGSSQWISSHAPAYGEGLATPYGPGGSFNLTIAVSPKINDSIDCRRVRCAIVTRNDHTRTSDRGQDIFLPVSFAAEPAPTDPGEPGQTGEPPATTTTTAPEVLPAPLVTLSEDGRVATAGPLSVEVSQARDLDRSGQPVTVAGSGFDEAKGIGVAYCVVNPDEAVPGPCADGSPNASTAVAWISSNPPEGGEGALPYQPGGSFSLSIATGPTIGDVDCSQATCAIVTSNDLTRPLDRSQDIVIPVTFKAAVAETTTSTASPSVDTELAVAPEDDGSSTSVWPFIVVGVVLVAGGGGLAYVIRAKRKDVTP